MVARFLLPALLLPVLMAAAPFSAPAHAAASLSFGPELGQKGGFAFEGLQGVAGSEDLAAILSLKLIGKSATSFTFEYAITNSSGGIVDAARLSSFGFDLDADYTSATASGLFNRTASGNIPGFGKTDLCVMAGGNGNSCAGTAKGGPVNGRRCSQGHAHHRVRDPADILRIENAFVRWQDVKSEALDLKSASGTPAVVMLDLPPFPEPSTWAMMIMGFGFVGFSARRRKIAPTVLA
jgi:hypothetical protein